LADAFTIEIPDRYKDRTVPFDVKNLTERTEKEAVNLAMSFVEGVFEYFAVDSEGAAFLKDRVLDSLRPRTSDDRLLRCQVRRMLLCDKDVDARAWFAPLTAAMTPKDLTRLFSSSVVTELKQDVELMQQPRRVYRRSRGVNEEDGVRKTQVVTITREREIELRAAWVTSKTRLDQASEDLNNLDHGRTLVEKEQTENIPRSGDVRFAVFG
jgi:hypothetical protein